MHTDTFSLFVMTRNECRKWHYSHIRMLLLLLIQTNVLILCNLRATVVCHKGQLVHSRAPSSLHSFNAMEVTLFNDMPVRAPQIIFFWHEAWHIQVTIPLGLPLHCALFLNWGTVSCCIQSHHLKGFYSNVGLDWVQMLECCNLQLDSGSAFSSQQWWEWQMRLPCAEAWVWKTFE
jgi:hypothetical protein